MKNRKREICTSGSVRDEAGQPPHLLGHRRQFLHLAAGAAALPTVSRFAWAQAYPSRPVRIVVGFPPGGGTDIAARLIGQGLSERLGQQFVIENHPGAGSNVATEAVVRASADGYTLLLVSAAHAINATLYDKLKGTSNNGRFCRVMGHNVGCCFQFDRRFHGSVSPAASVNTAEGLHLHAAASRSSVTRRRML